MTVQRHGGRIGAALPEPSIGEEPRNEVLRIWEIGKSESSRTEYVFCPREYADDDGDDYHLNEAVVWADRLANAVRNIATGISVHSGADRGEVLGHLVRSLQFNLMGEVDDLSEVERQ